MAYHAMVLIIGRSIGYVTNIVVGVVLVRMLTKFDYGTFLQVNLITGTVLSIALLGLPAALYYFIPQLKLHEIKRFILQNQLILLGLAIVSAAILYGSRNFIVRMMNNRLLGILIVFIMLLLVLQILSECIEPTLISLNKAPWVAGLNIASAIANIGLIANNNDTRPN